MHELILRSDKMIESDEEFIKQAHDLTDQLYKLGAVIEEMPNSNVLFVDCIKDGQKFIAILKLNYRTIPMSVVEDSCCVVLRSNKFLGWQVQLLMKLS